jgi:hypothetical protein
VGDQIGVAGGVHVDVAGVPVVKVGRTVGNGDELRILEPGQEHAMSIGVRVVAPQHHRTRRRVESHRELVDGSRGSRQQTDREPAMTLIPEGPVENTEAVPLVHPSPTRHRKHLAAGADRETVEVAAFHVLRVENRGS